MTMILLLTSIMEMYTKDTSSHTDGYGLSIGCSEKKDNDKTSVLNYKYGGACVYSKPIWASIQIRPVYDESLGN